MSCKEVTAGWEAGRLLLFIGLNEQGNYADDDKCVLKQFTICNHWTAPLSKDQRAETALRREGQPPTVTGSADSAYHIFRHFAIKNRPGRYLTIPDQAVILNSRKGAAGKRLALNWITK